MWSSYSARFAAHEGRGDAVPTRIAVMDERARSEMLAEGFDPERLVVTGHPAFDDLVAFANGFDGSQRAAMREAMGMTPSERVVLFASQPLAATWGEDIAAPGHPGYTERTAFAAFVPALERTVRRIGTDVTVILRPHPRDDREQTIPATSLRVRMSREGRPREAMLAADVVVGMCSVLLVENALLGRPTVSFQPGLRTPDPLPGPLHPAAHSVYRVDALDAALEDAIARAETMRAGSKPSASSLLTPGAADRVATLVRSLALHRSRS
jgi:hypothetical protein